MYFVFYAAVVFSGSHFGVALMHRKAEVKAIITEVIENMSNDEDEEEDDDDDEDTDSGKE